MIALNPVAALVVTGPAAPVGEADGAHTAAALLIVAAVMAGAVVTETVRHRRRARVHHPVPLPPRRRPVPVADNERSPRELARPVELAAHRP